MPTKEEYNDMKNSMQQETNDKYDLMKRQSYREMLQSEIQASAAKQNAMKYTQQQMSASGFGNQGLAESTRLGAYNNFQTALANAQNRYNDSVNNIEQQRLDQQEKDAATYLQEALTFGTNAATYSRDALDQEMINAGYMNPNGTWNYEVLDKMNPNDRLALEGSYRQALLDNQSAWDEQAKQREQARLDSIKQAGGVEYQAQNGSRVNTSFGKDNKVGADFDVTINGTTYKVQLGKDITNSIPQQTVNDLDYGQYTTIGLKDKNGNNMIYLITKDTDGRIRIVGNRNTGEGNNQSVVGKNTGKELLKLTQALGLRNYGNI